jgi:hypothetical protein
MKTRMITEPPLLVAANDDWRIHRCEDVYGQLHLFDTWGQSRGNLGRSHESSIAAGCSKTAGAEAFCRGAPVPPGKYPTLRQACQKAIDDLAREHPDWAPMRIEGQSVGTTARLPRCFWKRCPAR